MSKFLILIVLFAGLLMATCAPAHVSKPTVYNACSKDRPCSVYPYGCYCVPIDKKRGLLVNQYGCVDVTNYNSKQIRCKPNREQLARRDSYCLPFLHDLGLVVKNGRIARRLRKFFGKKRKMFIHCKPESARR